MAVPVIPDKRENCRNNAYPQSTDLKEDQVSYTKSIIL
jgi:hypothetical protein